MNYFRENLRQKGKTDEEKIFCNLFSEIYNFFLCLSQFDKNEHSYVV